MNAGDLPIDGQYLAMDLGGTKVEVALAVIADKDLESMRTIRLPTGDFREFGSVITAACEMLDIHDTRSISGVAVAVAGPVVGGRAQLTNIPWAVDRDQLVEVFSCDRVFLMNDMQAHGFAAVALIASAHGVEIPRGLLPASSSLMEGPVQSLGSAAVIAPGTGLGEGVIAWTGNRHFCLPSEGGHSSFAPINEEQMSLLTFLRREQGHHHVSWERVLSGKFGLPNLFLFVTRGLQVLSTTPSLEQAVLEGKRPVQSLVEAAENNDPAADKVLELFVTLLGQEAGNLALTVMATGGVFVSGGLAQRMSVAIKGPYLHAFREGMCGKGRFRDMLSRLPVQFLEDKATAIKGAMASILLQP